MKYNVLIGLVMMLMVSCNEGGQKVSKLTLEEMTDDQKVSYSYGSLIGDNLNQTEMKGLDINAIIEAIQDAAGGSETKVSIEEASINWQSFIQQLQQSQSGESEPVAADENVSYSYGLLIGDNLNQEGLENVDAGVVVQAIRDAVGEEDPLMSFEEAQTKWQTFAMALQQKQQEAELAKSAVYKEEGAAFLAENAKKDGIVTLDNGMQYEVIKKGSGAKPELSDRVEVHYHGMLIDETVFDSSVERGVPATFGVTEVIKGWTEILQMMPVGSKWKVFIPEDLAYGANPRPGGAIKPYMTLIFDIELISIK